MDLDTFGNITADGKILGRGASDTKGPMASMLQALSNCQDILAELPVAVDFIGFMGEEASQHGSKHFAANHASDYAFAIAGEPTSLDIVHVTRGSLWATLTATGKAAHASQPEKGENAIMKLARALDQLEQKLTPALAKFTHPVLGHSTLNVGTINGGKQPNIVPDAAKAQIDIRTTPSLHDDIGAQGLVENLITKLKLPIKLVNPHPNPPMDVPADNPWIQKLIAANPASQAVGAPWFSYSIHSKAASNPCSS